MATEGDKRMVDASMHSGPVLSTPLAGNVLERGPWMGFRAVDKAVVLAHVADVLHVASGLTPAELLAAVCEATATHLALAHVVLFKRVAGQSRTLVWSARVASGASRMAARERAWTSAAALIEGGPSVAHDSGQAASVSLSDERLGLRTMLYVESFRPLDAHDRQLLEELLRRMSYGPDGAELRC